MLCLFINYIQIVYKVVILKPNIDAHIKMYVIYDIITYITILLMPYIPITNV